MKKKLVSLALAASMAATMLTGCGSEFDGTQVVAEVGEEQIPAAVANFYARYQQSQYETYYSSYLGGDDMWATEVDTGVTYEDNVKESVMEAIHTLYVLELHAEEYGVELSEDEKAAITEAAEAFTESNGIDAIEAISGDQATVEEVLSLITIQNKMYTAMVADVDREVSDSEAAQKKMEYVWFSFSKTEDDGSTVSLTDDEKEALKADAEAFAEAAASEEDFTGFAEEKGYESISLTFDLSSTVPNSLLIAAADLCEEGEITDVIEGDDGYYVAKLISSFDEEATETKKEEIIYERESEQYETLCSEWMEETPITVNEDVWATVDFDSLGITIKDTETEE